MLKTFRLLIVAAIAFLCIAMAPLDGQILQKVFDKVVTTGKYEPSAGVYYVEKIERITDKHERRTYVAVMPPPNGMYIVIDDIYHPQPGAKSYLTTQIIARDSNYDGKVDYAVSQKLIKDIDGTVLSFTDDPTQSGDEERFQEIYNITLKNVLATGI